MDDIDEFNIIKFNFAVCSYRFCVKTGEPDKMIQGRLGDLYCSEQHQIEGDDEALKSEARYIDELIYGDVNGL